MAAPAPSGRGGYGDQVARDLIAASQALERQPRPRPEPLPTIASGLCQAIAAGQREAAPVLEDMLAERGAPLRVPTTPAALTQALLDLPLWSPLDQQLLCCELAERALPAWRRAHPKDERPAAAIAARRAWALGEADAETLHAARAAARSATRRCSFLDPAATAAWAAIGASPQISCWALARLVDWPEILAIVSCRLDAVLGD